MDLELIAASLTTIQEAVLRLDQRIDTLQQETEACQTSLTSLSETQANSLTMEQVTAQLAILSEQARIAEAEASAASSQAAEAQLEALQAEIELQETVVLAELAAAEEEAAGEAPVDLVEPETPEESQSEPPQKKSTGDLESFTRGK